MGKALVVVESPAKARTIGKYLGKDYDVKASKGHVKDLPKSTLGVDIDGGFEPHYEVINGRGAVLDEIRKAAKKAEIVYLAPDPDREGEAIAWHIASELKVPKERVRRVLFNEITKGAIIDALKNPLELDENRFNSQQARRILDRLVGYQISPLLWDKVRRGLSAGRVQSVAVRIVVEREREIRAFEPVEYWNIDGLFKGPNPPKFKARLHAKGRRKVKLDNEKEAFAARDAVKGGPFTVSKVKTSDRKQRPPAPFTTSRLQQDAARAFRFTAKRTMSIAQKLYEGIEIGEEGAVGLITYMRTDSTRLSDDAVSACRDYIEGRFGKNYLPKSPNVYKKKGRAQDAHEAIRPTSLERPPSKMKAFLKPEEFKLYSLIWNRFVACQMVPAIYSNTTIEIDAPNDYRFRTQGRVLKFDGFTAVYEEQKGLDDEKEAEGKLPKLAEGDVLELAKLDTTQHFTQPPPRFTEATLIRELEDKGIGRPSTYAAIISTIQTKEYVKKEKSRFTPTELGEVVNDLLVESFPQLFDVGFTAQMEDRLDQVESGSVDWKELLGGFWGDFSETLKVAREEMRNVKREEIPTDLECPKDAATLVIKFGKNGSFLACSNYPDCKFTSEFKRLEDGSIEMVGDELVGEDCSACDDGQLVYKKGRFGRFIGCSNYPECRHTAPISTGVQCPKCEAGVLNEKLSRRKKVFYSCSTYPKCDYATWDRPINTPCVVCGHAYVIEKSSKRGKGPVVCPSCNSEQGTEGAPEAEAAALG